MSVEIIAKYFHDVNESKNDFKPPATEEAFAAFESHSDLRLPIDYKDFLYLSNGFEGFINDFFVRFIAIEEIHKYTQDYCEEFFPWAIFIGTNGGNEMVVIDKREIPNQFGLLPFIADEGDYIPLGNTFEKFIELLYNNTAFESCS